MSAIDFAKNQINLASVKTFLNVKNVIFLRNEAIVTNVDSKMIVLKRKVIDSVLINFLPELKVRIFACSQMAIALAKNLSCRVMANSKINF